MFWRGVVGYLPVNVVQGLVGLLTIVAFTRLLTPAQFGEYALGFAVMSLLHTAVFTWNEAALARFQFGEADRGQAADHAGTVYRTWLMLLVTLPLAAGVTWLLPLNPGLKAAALAGVIAVLPRSFAKLAQERRRAIGDVRGSALIDVVQTVGAFVIGAGLAMAGAGGAAPVAGFGLAALLCCLWTWRSELAEARGGRFDTARAGRYLSYGAPVAASLILALALGAVDRMMIAAFLDEQAVGAYHAGYSLAGRTLDVVFIWLGAAGGPALIAAYERGGREGLEPAAREQASLMILLTLPAAVGLALVSAPLSGLMIGEGLRHQAAFVTPWAAASGLFAGLTTYYFHQAFTLGRRTRLLLAAMAVPAAANIGLNLALIPPLGLHGALISTVASYALGAAASIILGRRAMPLPFPWAAFAKSAAAVAVMAAAVSRIPAVGGALELALKAAAGAVVYGGLIWAMDAGGVRSRAGDALRLLRARAA